MKKAVKFISAAFMAASILFPWGASGAAEGNLIQMAILLDTSNSMDGLIDQAKSQLWRIVNELSQARKNGQSPRLEVALYEYGKSSLPEGEGYLRMIVPFTTELDRISEELFAKYFFEVWDRLAESTTAFAGTRRAYRNPCSSRYA